MGSATILAEPIFVIVCFELFQLGEGGFDAGYCFDDVLIAGGVAHAQVAWAAEGVACHTCHVGLLEQVDGEVASVVDNGVATLLAKECLNLGEHVERSVRNFELDAWNLLKQTSDEVAAALECHAHVFNALLRATVGGLGSFLSD